MTRAACLYAKWKEVAAIFGCPPGSVLRLACAGLAPISHAQLSVSLSHVLMAPNSQVKQLFNKPLFAVHLYKSLFKYQFPLFGIKHGVCAAVCPKLVQLNIVAPPSKGRIITRGRVNSHNGADKNRGLPFRFSGRLQFGIPFFFGLLFGEGLRLSDWGRGSAPLSPWPHRAP